MLAGLRGVVHSPGGTAYGIFAAPLADDIAGKTGTAQVQGKQSTRSSRRLPRPATRITRSTPSSSRPATARGRRPSRPEIYDGLYGLPLQPVAYSSAGGGGQN